MLRKVLLVTLLAALPLAALSAACGGGSDKTVTPTTVAPEKTVTLQTKNVKFVPDHLTIPIGSVVELKLENLDATEHDFQVDGLDADVMSGGSTRAEHGGGEMHGAQAMGVALHTMANETGSVIFRAKTKGTYNFYCTITGHKEAGMVGTLTVE